MNEYKICPFCGKATDAAKSNCDFCGGFIEFLKLKTTDLSGAARLNREDVEGIVPVGEFRPYDFIIIQVLTLLASVLYLFFNPSLSGPGGPGSVMGIFVPFLFMGSWLLFGKFLRKFTGTDRIADPLINMNYFYIGAIAIFLFFVTIAGFVAVLLSAAAVFAGFAHFIVAAVRMLRARNGYLPLGVVGFVIIISSVLFMIVRFVLAFMYPGMVVAYRLEIIGAVLSILPNLSLIPVLGYARRKILTDDK